ncbi:DUF982 domain-containing protein [Rhizobium sp. WYJ-E13]|uniref:DUF982 domain-containing protein n=1 Tax=Rhizobium sp. WYJ-E13 TaxID=2849093 RepID=UPI001C1F0106|nr:DUF982 domain-containing protein [Rhizobium sp. WYJ-E13]QWW66798.1 DUF982 domain-containing protein [Rhizobium sp. WYJ-E13]
MEWDTPIEFDPVILMFHDPDRLLSVRTAIGAANALMKDFPSDDGEEFLAAIKVCLDVVQGTAEPWELRAAIIRAAAEAGITAIAVLH